MNSMDKRRSVNGRPQRIAVVGAGITGLAAARTLHDHGQDVQVFDKGRGVGGRTSVRRQAPFEFDHGAQYFTARAERFSAQVTDWREAGVVATWSGRIGSLERGMWRDSSPQERYVGVPGMNAIAKYLAAGLNVTTETRVAKLTWDGQAWRLSSDGGAALGLFDAAIVAVPAPQATDLLAGQTALVEQAARCAMSPCWAVMLGFESALPIPYDGVFVSGSPLSWMARNSSKPGRSSGEAWVLHAGPEWSAAHIDDHPELVIAALNAELERALGGEERSPAHAAAHRWRYAMPAEPLRVGALWDADSRLAVCGDWCQGARIEGAFLSGWAAADRVLRASGGPADFA